MHSIAALTFWPLLALVVTPALVLAIPVVVHHAALDIRERRTRRRDLELIRSRREAHEVRQRTQYSQDDRSIAAALTERDQARRAAIDLLARNDQLQAELTAVRGELAGARSWASRINRPLLADLADVIEADQTMRLPAVGRPTRELPALPYRVLQGAAS